MKIALATNIWGLVTKKYAQGISEVVYNLAYGLKKRGHDVTLFAPRGSKTPAKLFQPAPEAILDHLKIHREDKVAMFHRLLHAGIIAKEAHKYDIVHSHIETDFLPFAKIIKTPTLTTIHGIASSYPIRKKIFLAYKDQNFVSLSDAARKNLPRLNYVDTVYNGIEVKKFKANTKKAKDYYIWLGRFNGDKSPHLACEVAIKTKTKLYLAGSGQEFSYFKEKIKPLLKSKYVELLPWLFFEKKNEYLMNAKAFLMPIRWEEPFGLVVTEAHACGTPVIAFNRGSMGELIEDGKNGFLVKTVPQMIAATKKLDTIDRAYCRSSVEENFTIDKMVDSYEKLYKKIAKKKRLFS